MITNKRRCLPPQDSTSGKNLRVGFHYHTPFLVKDGSIYMPGYFGRFVETLASRCEKLICFLHQPRKHERQLIDYRITKPNIRIVDLGHRTSIPVRTIFGSWYCHKLVDELASIDALLLRGPSPLLPAMAKAAAPLPTVLYLVGDYLSGIDDLSHSRWRKEFIRIWAQLYKRQQQRAARRSTPLVISQSLFDEFRVISSKTTLVTAASVYRNDFYSRADSCSDLPIRLLFVGQVHPFKGVLDIIEAVHLLRNDGIHAMLEIVGWVENKKTMFLLEQKATALNITDHIVFHGYKTFGPELFRHYKEADIFVIAQRGDEGGPRVIWEAMTFGLPVVCTRVGGIPEFLVDGLNARLVSSRDSHELAQAIRSIVEDGELRRRLIRNGHELARGRTIEALVDSIMTHLEQDMCSELPPVL